MSDKKLSRASAMFAMRKCNFLCSLPLVNQQAATLINTIRTNVSQHCHPSIYHSDISSSSFFNPVLPLARSQMQDGEETKRSVEMGEGIKNRSVRLRRFWMGARQCGNSAASPKTKEENKQKRITKKISESLEPKL